METTVAAMDDQLFLFVSSLTTSSSSINPTESSVHGSSIYSAANVPCFSKQIGLCTSTAFCISFEFCLLNSGLFLLDIGLVARIISVAPTILLSVSFPSRIVGVVPDLESSMFISSFGVFTKCVSSIVTNFLSFILDSATLVGTDITFSFSIVMDETTSLFLTAFCVVASFLMVCSFETFILIDVSDCISSISVMEDFETNKVSSLVSIIGFTTGEVDSIIFVLPSNNSLFSRVLASDGPD